MFGKGIIKLIGYAIAGAIALAAGAQILTSAVSVVLAFRMGDSIPLLLVIVLTVFVLFVSNHLKESSPAQLVLNITGYLVSGYLIIVMFVISLPLGLIISFIVAGIVGVLCSILRNPQSFQKSIQGYFPKIQLSEIGISKRVVPLGDGISFNLTLSHHIVILTKGQLDKVTQLMRNRPLLPISVTHYEDCDVLFISEDTTRSMYEQILKLLHESGIISKKRVSPLFAEAIQMVPIIDARNGLKMEEYCVTKDESTVNHLISIAPQRMTVFPTVTGLGIIVPEVEAPGLIVERLKRGVEFEVLLHRDFTHLPEVEKVVESTT